MEYLFHDRHPHHVFQQTTGRIANTQNMQSALSRIAQLVQQKRKNNSNGTRNHRIYCSLFWHHWSSYWVRSEKIGGTEPISVEEKILFGLARNFVYTFHAWITHKVQIQLQFAAVHSLSKPLHTQCVLHTDRWPNKDLCLLTQNRHKVEICRIIGLLSIGDCSNFCLQWLLLFLSFVSLVVDWYWPIRLIGCGGLSLSSLSPLSFYSSLTMNRIISLMFVCICICCSECNSNRLDSV